MSSLNAYVSLYFTLTLILTEESCFYPQIGRVSSGSKLAALAGRFSDAEGLMALKDMMNQLGSETVCVEEPFPHVGASYVSPRSRFRGR